jgi:hypothetical protein
LLFELHGQACADFTLGGRLAVRNVKSWLDTGRRHAKVQLNIFSSFPRVADRANPGRFRAIFHAMNAA